MSGLEYGSADVLTPARLNQKTRFIGTGAQIAAIGTTYPGMAAFCTSTGSGFTVNTEYVRNNANDGWLDFSLGNIASVGDTLTHSHDAESGSNSATYAKIKTITIDKLLGAGVSNATLRIKFDFRNTTAGQTTYGRIYKGGVAFGTERTTVSADYSTVSEDLSFAEGNTIELWYKEIGSGTARLRNLRVYVSEDAPTLAQALANSEIDADPFQGTNT